MSLGHIGRYETLQPLGRGGMAEVFLARAIGDPRSVVYALKCILPQFADDPRFVQMFHRELTIATGLCHPNLVSVLDHGVEHGRAFMVMEYVHGPDLAKLLRSAGERDVRPPLAAALSIVASAARGLHHLHEWPGKHGGTPGFVHRDVSPSNVLVGYDGTVKVTDFGVATASAHTRTTEAGGVKGKMGYLSPEQCRSEALDRRSDVFALGVLLYEATLGERLFYADNDYAVMHKIVSAEFDRPSHRDSDYPAGLEAIVLRALSADPADRFATAEAFALAIEQFADQHSVVLGRDVIADWVIAMVPWTPYPAFTPSLASLAPATLATEPAPTIPPRSRRWIAAAVVAPLLAGLALGLWWNAGDGDTQEPRRAAARVEHEAIPGPVEAGPTVVPADAPPPRAPSTIATAVRPAEPPQTSEVIEVVEVIGPTPEESETGVQAPEHEDLRPKVEPKKRRKRRRQRKKTSPPRYDLDAAQPPR